MKETTRRYATVATVFALALAAMSGAAVASSPTATTDNETTNTAAESSFVSGTVFQFNGSAGSQENFSVVIKSDTNNSKVAIEVNETGQLLWANSSMEEVAYNASGNKHYTMRANLTESDLREMERSIGENVTLDLVMINDTSVDDPLKNKVQFYAENSDETSVNWVSASETSSDESAVATTETVGRDIGPLESHNAVSISGERSTNGSNTTITYVVAESNSNVSDSITNASDRMGSLNSGDWFVLSTSKVEDGYVKTYVNSAPSDANGTYAVYHSDYQGKRAYTFHYGDHYDGDKAIHQTVRVNAAPEDLSAIAKTFGTSAAIKVLRTQYPMI